MYANGKKKLVEGAGDGCISMSAKNHPRWRIGGGEHPFPHHFGTKFSQVHAVFWIIWLNRVFVRSGSAPTPKGNPRSVPDPRHQNFFNFILSFCLKYRVRATCQEITDPPLSCKVKLIPISEDFFGQEVLRSFSSVVSSSYRNH